MKNKPSKKTKNEQEKREKVIKLFGALFIEYMDSRFNEVYEYLQMNIERLDREHAEFEISFAQKEKWLNNHESRLLKLEGSK